MSRVETSNDAYRRPSTERHLQLSSIAQLVSRSSARAENKVISPKTFTHERLPKLPTLPPHMKFDVESPNPATHVLSHVPGP